MSYFTTVRQGMNSKSGLDIPLMIRRLKPHLHKQKYSIDDSAVETASTQTKSAYADWLSRSYALPRNAVLEALPRGISR